MLVHFLFRSTRESRSIIVSSYVPSLHTLLIYLYEVTNNDKCDCLEQRVSRSVSVLNLSFWPLLACALAVMVQ